MIWERFSGGFAALALPDSAAEVMDGIPWGRAEQLFSPAYWAVQAWLVTQNERSRRENLGDTLLEEAAACILGGHGMPAEVGLAAFYHLRALGLLATDAAYAATVEELTAALSGQLSYGGRRFRYRFPNQKARVLAPVLRGLATNQPDTRNHLAFRRWFLRFSGVGLKTASWITRNWLKSDRVAIIDIHICRAGILAGIFSFRDRPATQYEKMEQRFLSFCEGIGVPANLVDAIMWRHVRLCSSVADRMLEHRAATIRIA
ncbi:MAG: 8-oxoguanine DNA glycosylase [Chthoniobacterales bacterium]